MTKPTLAALVKALTADEVHLIEDLRSIAEQSEGERVPKACREAANMIERFAVARSSAPAVGKAVDRAAEERDALLSALGWKTGPFPNEGTRKVVLDDSAALRPAMVEARRQADDASADRDIWRMIAGERVEDARSGLLLRVWNQMNDERRRRIKAEAALRAIAGFELGADPGKILLQRAWAKMKAVAVAAFSAGANNGGSL